MATQEQIKQMQENIINELDKPDFSLDACLESVVFDVEHLKSNPFELLGEYSIRAELDPFFNKRMIDAVKKYIKDNELYKKYVWGRDSWVN